MGDEERFSLKREGGESEVSEEGVAREVGRILKGGKLGGGCAKRAMRGHSRLGVLEALVGAQDLQYLQG